MFILKYKYRCSVYTNVCIGGTCLSGVFALHWDCVLRMHTGLILVWELLFDLNNRGDNFSGKDKWSVDYGNKILKLLPFR